MAAKNAVALEQLEETISQMQEFLKLWVQFERSVRDAHHNLNINDDSEKRFLQLKSTCARKHEYLYRKLDTDYLDGEPITAILRRCVTLKQLSQTRDENYFSIQTEWNLRYLHLQETLAAFQWRRDAIM